MKEFRFTLQNQPGALAKVATALGAENVNIDGISGAAAGDKSLIRLVVDDPGLARTALQNLAVSFEEKDALAIDIANRPGELGKLLERVAKVGINVESTYTAVGPNKVVLTVDDLAKAKQTLGVS